MQAATSTSSSVGAPAGRGPSETVVRPDPGLARGVWEAPTWLFWVFLALVVLGGAAYLLRRLGVLRFGIAKFGRGRAADDAGPRSHPSGPSSSPRSRRP